MIKVLLGVVVILVIFVFYLYNRLVFVYKQLHELDGLVAEHLNNIYAEIRWQNKIIGKISQE